MYKNLTSANIMAYSESPQGDRVVTYKLVFPRIILPEKSKHRMSSFNTSSSRAVNFVKMVDSVRYTPFVPIAFQKSHKGMQGTEYLTDEAEIEKATQAWLKGRDYAIESATNLYDCNVTKQLCNRMLEPYSWCTVILTTGMEGLENFFKLRCPQYYFEPSNKYFRSKKEFTDEYNNVLADNISKKLEITEENLLGFLALNKSGAEIHISDLAEKMYDALKEANPKKLKEGEWHIPHNIPFVGNLVDCIDVNNTYWKDYDEQNKVKISTALSAKTSYTTIGEEKEVDYNKLISLHNNLIKESHDSPLEHCLRAMNDDTYQSYIKGNYQTNGKNVKNIFGWCDNFKGFQTYRHLITNK